MWSRPWHCGQTDATRASQGAGMVALFYGLLTLRRAGYPRSSVFLVSGVVGVSKLTVSRMARAFCAFCAAALRRSSFACALVTGCDLMRGMTGRVSRPECSHYEDF